MTKQEKIDAYNPSGIGMDNGHVYGLPFEFEESDIVILPVPWEVTTSFGSGCSLGPKAILEASPQLDLFHFDRPEAWKQGIYFLEVSSELVQLNKKYKIKAQEIILLQEKGKTVASLAKEIDEINQACDEMRKWVLEQSKVLLNRGKKLILLGGDHSTPLGYIQALAQQYPSFAILQIDAHADLRKSYEGFEFSHASIMYNALKLEQVSALVQVGIRDICEEELALINKDERVTCFFDHELKRENYKGVTWSEQVERIVASLPEHVYISFDIDGLDPKLCPNTGTPVPGGFEFQQAVELIKAVAESGKKIIGCDLNEVGNDAWDANVGSRLLYQLCCYI